jgi:hypothetical protein
MTNRKIEYWVIPPEADAEFVAGMEDVLEIYAKPYDAVCPVICMDEQPVQLLKETRRLCWLSGNRNFVWTALMRGKGRHPVEKSRHRAAKV